MNPGDGKADLKNSIKKGDLYIAEFGVELLSETKKIAEICPMQIIKVGK